MDIEGGACGGNLKNHAEYGVKGVTLKRWLPLLSKFLGGQALLQAINMVTALLLLRLLSVGEYALFTLANSYIAFCSLCANNNLSNALTAFGARRIDDKLALGRLFSSTVYLGKWSTSFVSIFVLVVSPYTLKGHGLTVEELGFFIVLVVVISQNQVMSSFRTAILNIFHDVNGVIQSGFTGAVIKLGFVYLLCSKWSYALVAIFVYFFTGMIVNRLLKRRCGFYIDEGYARDDADVKLQKQYIYPMLPAVIYFAFQGQVSVFLISLFGGVQSLAEVGALGRFGQIFGLFGMLNGFFFLPKFAQFDSRSQFIQVGRDITLILAVAFGLLWLTALLLPDWWLLLLGKNYASLQAEVPIALAGSIAFYFEGFFYTLLISQGYTKGRNWYVALTLAVQITFISFIGVDNTHKALLLNLANAIVVLVLQMILLVRFLKAWKEPYKTK